MQHTLDSWHMKSALNLASQGLGRVSPNPSVGCIIVKEGRVVGRSRTADGGRPHAETQALSQAGKAAQGSTVYVTLEPCAHQGETGACAKALIEAGVQRIVVATLDPDSRVSGAGVALLKQAGIEVDVGVLQEEAQTLNQGYLLSRTQNRPLVTLKMATTLDSKIATEEGESQWITGALARQRGHLERAQHDAIAVGIGTVLADHPSLLARLDGVHYKGIRVVFDTNLQLSGSKWFFEDLEQSPVWVLCGLSRTGSKVQVLEKKGARVVCLPQDKGGQVDVTKALNFLAKEGVTRLLVEGGARLNGSFLRQKLWDRLLWFRHASLLRGRGERGDSVPWD